jgi:hypothetical protein
MLYPPKPAVEIAPEFSRVAGKHAVAAIATKATKA